MKKQNERYKLLLEESNPIVSKTYSAFDTIFYN